MVDYRFTLELTDYTVQKRITVSQGEAAARKFIINFSENGKPYKLNPYSRVVFRMRTPSGNDIFNHCVVSGNTVEYIPTSISIAENGLCEARVEIYGNDSTEVLYSPKLELYIEENPYNDSVVEGSNELTALQEALNDVSELMENLGGPEGVLARAEEQVDLAKVEVNNAKDQVDLATVYASEAGFKSQEAWQRAEDARAYSEFAQQQCSEALQHSKAAAENATLAEAHKTAAENAAESATISAESAENSALSAAASAEAAAENATLAETIYDKEPTWEHDTEYFYYIYPDKFSFEKAKKYKIAIKGEYVARELQVQFENAIDSNYLSMKLEYEEGYYIGIFVADKDYSNMVLNLMLMDEANSEVTMSTVNPSNVVLYIIRIVAEKLAELKETTEQLTADITENTDKINENSSRIDEIFNSVAVTEELYRFTDVINFLAGTDTYNIYHIDSNFVDLSVDLKKGETYVISIITPYAGESVSFGSLGVLYYEGDRYTGEVIADKNYTKLKYVEVRVDADYEIYSTAEIVIEGKVLPESIMKIESKLLSGTAEDWEETSVADFPYLNGKAIKFNGELIKGVPYKCSVEIQSDKLDKITQNPVLYIYCGEERLAESPLEYDQEKDLFSCEFTSGSSTAAATELLLCVGYFAFAEEGFAPDTDNNAVFGKIEITYTNDLRDMVEVQSKKIGDIETALDGIIAIQENLIGGETS